MSPAAPVPQRFARLLAEVAARLKLRGRDPTLELAGRFGLRRYFERHQTGDTDLADSKWLERAAQLRKEARDLSAALRRLRLRDWLSWAGRNVADTRHHVTVTRSLAWRRFLLADAPDVGQLTSELFRPSAEYLGWRWPEAKAPGQAWRQHLASALRA